jgi:2-amino-4,5-dihydroxy-6-oxo-7-(phosphonooxy)heptanoate synthase
MEEHTGRRLRLKRLYKHNVDRLFIVPMDHSVTDGPFARNIEYDRILGDIGQAGVDAVVLHKGRLRALPEDFYRATSVIVHVSASTKYAPDVNEKYVVASVESAVRRGADGISMHINLGSPTEARQLRDLAEVADACEEVGVPLLVMLYARGQQMSAFPNRDTLAHAATLAADFGADIVKLALPNDAEDIAWITSRCPVPIIAAGGAKLDERSFIGFVQNVVKGGGAGLAAGRNVFMSDNVVSLGRRVRACLDGRLSPAVAELAVSGGGRSLARELTDA